MPLSLSARTEPEIKALDGSFLVQ